MQMKPWARKHSSGSRSFVAIRLNPEFHPAYRELGSALADQGGKEGSVSAYTEAVRLRPEDPESHTDLAGAFYRAGDMERAVSCYRESLRLDPKHVARQKVLGLYLRDRFEERLPT